jgi:hypothetical protein
MASDLLVATKLGLGLSCGWVLPSIRRFGGGHERGVCLLAHAHGPVERLSFLA